MAEQTPIVESAKQRSLRIPLDYYRRGDRLARTKWQLSLAGVVLTAVYVAWLLFGGRGARQQLSPGPVAGVHAAWNDDCQACHQDFRPLRSDSFDWREMPSLTRTNEPPSDAKCATCHQEPAHHPAATLAGEMGCANCHQDHRGTAAEIRRAADTQCLECHRSIAKNRRGTSSVDPPIGDVSGFREAGDGSPSHPEFRSLEHDPGNIKFNHWLHLQPGIAPLGAKQLLSVASIDGEGRYQRFANAAGLVQLDCSACHEPGDDGKLMRPIAYDRHCQACHPITVPTDAEMSLVVPHGLPADRLGEVVDGLLFRARQSEAAAGSQNLGERGELPLIPGRTLGNNLAQKIQHDVLGQRQSVFAALQVKCLQCHFEGTRPEPPYPAPELFELLPAKLPRRWLQHARFDHSAHRHTECRTCHQDAYAFEKRDAPQFLSPGSLQLAGSGIARDDQQVMIAGSASCLACHSSSRAASGGARHDCAECHAYHGREEHLDLMGDTHTARNHDLSLVSLRATTRTLELSSAIGSCAAAGCHGSTIAVGPAWKSAFAKWAILDPHAKAYDVLWTERSRAITRSLMHRGEATSAAEHSETLQQRCVGCHATEGGSKSALGVSCESCHGAAGEWLHTHYRSDFHRDEAKGFQDTKNLQTRANVCMPCHVGPGGGQTVDHDLIAAGHPRLAFDFRSYLESLPAHWDGQRERERLRGDYQFLLWSAGQQAQRSALTALRAGGRTLDFSQIDCARCHHALAGKQPLLASLGEALRPTKLPIEELPERLDNLSIQERLLLAERLLKHVGDEPTWDGSVQAYLAVRAIAGDLPEGEDAARIKAELRSLGSYLARDCFREVLRADAVPSVYDSPAQFDPEDLATRIEPLMNSLQAAGGRRAP